MTKIILEIVLRDSDPVSVGRITDALNETLYGEIHALIADDYDEGWTYRVVGKRHENDSG